EHRTPAIDDTGNQPFIPVGTQRVDVSLYQVDADGVNRKAEQLVDVGPGVAEVDVEGQRRVEVAVQDLERLFQWHPVFPGDADVAEPGIFQVDHLGACGNRGIDGRPQNALGQVDHEAVSVLIRAGGPREHVGGGERRQPRTGQGGIRNDA